MSVFEGTTRLLEPWRCSVVNCSFSTTVKRARAAHLLRAHHLKFMGVCRDPEPLAGTELQERLEAFRRRNRGSQQRAKENRRLSEGRGGDGPSAASAPAQQPVAEAPDGLVTLEDEDWGSAVVDFQLLLDEDLDVPSAVQVGGVAVEVPEFHEEWMMVPYVPPPPPDLELMPRGIPVCEFTAELVTWTGLSFTDAVERARLCWSVPTEDLPRLRLAIQMVLGTRMNDAFRLLDCVQLALAQDPSCLLNELLRMTSV